MEAYLDNSATTAVTPEVAEFVCKIMVEDYGNDSTSICEFFETQKCKDYFTAYYAD